MSCFSPLPVYYLKPIENETEWYNGREVIKKNKNHMTIFINFDQSKDGYFIFDTEIHNFKKDVISVFPEGFYINVLEDIKDTVGVYKYFSYDPEIMLLDIQNKISEENASYLNYLSSQVILRFFNIVTDIATIGTPETDEQLDKKIERNQQQEISMSDREARHLNRINELEYIYENISTTALRKTTIKRFDSIKGKIYLPVIHNIEYFRLIIPVGGETFDFLFQQVKYNKNSKEFQKQILKPLK